MNSCYDENHPNKLVVSIEIYSRSSFLTFRKDINFMEVSDCWTLNSRRSIVRGALTPNVGTLSAVNDRNYHDGK